MWTFHAGVRRRAWSSLTIAVLFAGLTLAALHERLDAIRGTVIGIYTAYLLPYIAISYYERYPVPILGVKALLIVWAADRLPCGGTARPPLPRGGGGAGTSSRAHAGVT